MELTKKTTILFSPESHQYLTRVAAQRGVSLGELVREACVVTYGEVDQSASIGAVSALSFMSLPVGTPAAMKRESVPTIGTQKR